MIRYVFRAGDIVSPSCFFYLADSTGRPGTGSSSWSRSGERSRSRSCRPELAVAVFAFVLVEFTLLSSAFASTRAYTFYFFRGPGGNVVCGYFAGGGAGSGTPYLDCGMKSVLSPAPPRPTSAACGNLDFASNRVRLRPTGHVQGFCSGDVGVLAELGSATPAPLRRDVA